MKDDIQPKIAGSAAFAATFGVSRETLARLNLYESLLREWQKHINLVANGTLDAVWHRHFADSAQLARLIPAEARTIVDLGSGAGFPGLVLAIMRAGEHQVAAGHGPPAWGPDSMPKRVVLIESDHRKAAFMREVARQVGVAVEILSIRIETLETQSKLAPVDVVCARALAPLDRLLGLAVPLFGDDTVGLFLKGQGAQAEVDVARRQWSFDVTLVPSVTAADAGIAAIRKLRVRSGA